VKVGDMVKVSFGNVLGLAKIAEDMGFDFYRIFFQGELRMMHSDFLTVVGEKND
jgi:hypothetical protein